MVGRASTSEFMHENQASIRARSERPFRKLAPLQGVLDRGHCGMVFIART
jgi:hypothetical protein